MNNTPEIRFEFERIGGLFIRRNLIRERCDIAKDRLLEFAGRESQLGIKFLDIGCGSALYSLAALGAN